MSVLSRVHSAQRIKPGKWPLSYGRVAPEWRWAWRDLAFVSPIWEGGGPSRDLVSNAGLVGFDIDLFDSLQYLVGQIGLYHELTNQAGEWPISNPVSGYPFVQAVVMRGGNSNNGTVLDLTNSVETDINFAIWENTNTATIWHRNGSGNQTAGSLSVAPPDWHTVVIVHRSSNQHDLYVDGVFDVSDTGTSTFPATTDRISTGKLGDGTPSNAWDGDLALALLADREWTDAEIRQFARDPFGPFRMARRTWSVIQTAAGTTQNVTATLAGTSTDSVGSIILNLTGTTTLAGTSTTGGAITTTDLVALTATLAGTSTDTAAVSLKEAITATLAGMSVDGGAVSIKDVVALAATLAGTSEDSAKVSLGPLVPGTYTTYDAVGIREDLQGKARGRSMSKRALETAEQQLNDLLNNR